jgi:hypothetical protein
MELLINILGWIGSILIVGAFGLNSLGKISSDTKIYQIANIIGGICFIVNTIHLKAYPSAFVNVVWVIIGFVALSKKKE